jgi:hypothetical protein
MKQGQGSVRSERPVGSYPSQPLCDKAQPANEREAQAPEAPAALPEEELPEIHEATKVVLLPVNPYLAHVYWRIAPGDLREIGKVLAKPDLQAQPILRFYDITDVHPEDIEAHRWFDVEIDLRTGNWYVHLERPAKSCCIDLGLRIKGRKFRPLARSNVALTPRDRPSEKTEESFLPLGVVSRAFETVDMPGIEPREPAKTPPKRPQVGGLPPPLDKELEPRELWTFRITTPEEIERKVEWVYQQRMREQAGATPQGKHIYMRRHPGRGVADITELSELSFRAGMSASWTTSAESPKKRRQR